MIIEEHEYIYMYSVTSLVRPRMEEPISGTNAIKKITKEIRRDD